MAKRFVWIAWLLAPLAQAADAPRVVALGGDVTEIVYALQAQQNLVGVDSTSQFPAAAAKLPNVGYVRQLNAEGVLALRPTLVLATHDAGPPVVIDQLRQAGVTVQWLPNEETPAGVLGKVATLGHALGRDAQARVLQAQLAQSYAQLQRQTQAMPTHPRVVFLLAAGAGNLLAAGRDTAADHAIALAGGSNAITAYAGYKPLSAEALIAAKPDVLLVMSEGPAADVKPILALPGVAQTAAGARQRVWFVDGQALLGFGVRNAAQEQALQQKLAGIAP